MNDIQCDPSLGLLIFKIIYFLFITYLTGWSVCPYPIYKQSRIPSWVFCQSVGTALLLLIGFNMVSFNIPAKWLILVPPLLILMRFISNKLSPKKSVPYFEKTDSLSHSFFIYALGSLGIMTIYLMPFILAFTSGLYAYGGGDHSSYFRVSDFVVNESIKNLMISWGLAWPQPSDIVHLHETSSMLPPAPSWSMNSFLFYIKYTRQSMTFANQTIGVPFIALGLNNSEESYTAGVTVYLLLLCWSAAIFTAVILKNIHRAWTISLVAFAIALASPAMSLVLKQTIPAVYAWGSMLIFLSVLIHRKNENNKKLGTPILFGISIASTYLMYLPAIFVSGPLWAYQFLKGMKESWKERIKWLLIVLFILIASTNWEIDRPIRLFLSNAIGAILDYNLKLYYLPYTLLGVADFESVLQNVIYYPLCIIAATVVLIGLFYYLIRLKKEIIIVLVFALPILLLIAYYWEKGGQYHVIRMVEFLSVIFVAMSMMGYCYALGLASRIHRITILGLISIFVINAIFIKIYINKSILSPIPNGRAGMITAGDMKLAKDFQQDFSHLKEKPVIYWMGWGTVPFANHEIMFRRFNYLEAFEYDYSNFGANVLNPAFINNAWLVFPIDTINDILQVNPAVFSNAKYHVEDKFVQKVGKGSGAVLLGTAWMPPTMEKGKPVRYLRSNEEGGIVIWSDTQKTIQVEIEASGAGAGMFLTLRKPEIENEMLITDKTILRNKFETSDAYFLRIEKLINNKRGSTDFLYSIKALVRTHLYDNSDNFNKILLNSDLFKQFLIYNIESKSELTKKFENHYDAQQLTYLLASYHDPVPTTIRFSLNLHQGANLIRLIARDSLKRRLGRDPLTGIFYNPEIDMPYIIINKIMINPINKQLAQL